MLLAAPAQALGAQDDTIPGVPISGSLLGSLTGGDVDDVYRLYLLKDEQVVITMYEDDPPGSDIDIFLFGPGADDFTGTVVDFSATLSNPESFGYQATEDGWHYLNVRLSGGTGKYELRVIRGWLAARPPAEPQRVWGSDRYKTSVQIAEKNFPGWRNCDHVIIASGEDRAAADPLAASGLTWTYGAPILLVQQDSVPSSVMSALQAISAQNGGVTIHVVGGPVSIPDARLGEIAGNVPAAAFDRVAPNTDRFVLAATIARRMHAERPDGFHRTDGFGQFALVANGADPGKFFDALALSPLTARTGYPILLVSQDSIPSATRSALNDLAIAHRIVGGGPATVSDDVLAELGSGGALSARWAGADRYETAVEIAEAAIAAPTPWVWPNNVGVTAKLPDALTGGAYAGLRGAPIVLTQTDSLPSSTRNFLRPRTDGIGAVYVLGGPVSITEGAREEIRNSLIP
jgi:hypothetical protein